MRERQTRVALAALIFGALGVFAGAQTGSAANDHQARTAKNATMFPHLDTGRRLETMKPDANGIIDLTPRGLIYSYPGRSSNDTPQKELARKARVSEAIIEGVAEQRESALTSNHAMVFSEWTIRVTQILKNDFSVPIPLGGAIIGAQPGGDLELNGVHVQAHSPLHPELSAGHKYIIYMRPVPQSKSFIVQGLFDISGEKPILMDDPKDIGSTLWEFCAAETSESLKEAVLASVYQ